MHRQSWFILLVLTLGFIFLYAPIVSLVIFSFNASKLVTVWGGFSTKWYGALVQDQQILDAAMFSLRIAAISATLATILGVMAGYVLVRFHKFRGRAAFSGMVTAPLVMPEVITGISLLLLFISMEQLIGWPQGRGLTTIIIAHTTFTMSYSAVVMRSRFLSLDISLEEAAMDLGAKPSKVFFVITLPIVAPAVISSWLLCFTISLDDLVITSFTNGPGTTTLPQVIFSKVRLGLDPKVNALATIIISIVATGVIISSFYMRHKEHQRQRDEQMAIRAASQMA
ncbi:ABC transporter permease subunit [Dongia soli]|uniref:ABC transporter permease subunit n=1 Tax=Dongia soli TaxID=600628 RepID=A0ABU5EAJ8_9PROT|nr:ABC transporter permease subunit [Dongia soli]MDY0883274.1 ABC transporter permease subunit [Dongia soli]